MRLKVGNQRLEVERAAVAFRLGDTPEVRASLRPGDRSLIASAQVAARAEARLVSDSSEPQLEGWLRGRITTPQVTLLIEPYDPEQREWFSGVNLRRAVYQRLEDEAWEFLAALFADRLAASEECKAAIEAWLPQGVCLLREAGFSTARWIGELAGTLAGSGVLGWYGRLRTDGVRLVSIHDPPIVATECDWIGNYVAPSAAGASTPPLQIQGRVALGANGPLRVLDEILRDAESPSVTHPLLQVRPGPLNVLDEEVLVEAVTFESFQDEPASVRVELSVRMPVEPSRGSTIRRRWRTAAMVNGWEKDGWEDGATSLLSVTPEGIESRVSVDPRGVESRDLVAHALSPAPVRDSAAGFYSSRSEAHEVVLDLATGEVPWVAGAVQVFDEQLEGAQLSLQAQDVAVTSSPRGTALDDAAGLQLSGGGKATLRTGQDGRIELTTGTATIDAGEKTTVRGSEIALGGETVIDGKAILTGDVEMGSA